VCSWVVLKSNALQIMLQERYKHVLRVCINDGMGMYQEVCIKVVRAFIKRYV